MSEQLVAGLAIAGGVLTLVGGVGWVWCAVGWRGADVELKAAQEALAAASAAGARLVLVKGLTEADIIDLEARLAEDPDAVVGLLRAALVRDDAPAEPAPPVRDDAPAQPPSPGGG